MRRAWSWSICCWWATITAVCATSMMVSAAPIARRRCGLRHASFVLPTSFLTLCDDKGQRAKRAAKADVYVERPPRGDRTPHFSPSLRGEAEARHGRSAGGRERTCSLTSGARSAREEPKMRHGLRRPLSAHNRYERDGPGTAPGGRLTIPRRATGASGTIGGATPIRALSTTPTALSGPAQGRNTLRCTPQESASAAECLTCSWRRRNDSILPVLPGRAVLPVRALLPVLPVRAVLACRADRATGTRGTRGTRRP